MNKNKDRKDAMVLRAIDLSGKWSMTLKSGGNVLVEVTGAYENALIVKSEAGMDGIIFIDAIESMWEIIEKEGVEENGVTSTNE